MLPVKPALKETAKLMDTAADPFEEDRRTLLILNETIAYISLLQQLAKAKSAQKS